MPQDENEIRWPPRQPNNRFGDMAGGIVPAGGDAGRLGKFHDALAAWLADPRRGRFKFDPDSKDSEQDDQDQEGSCPS